MVNCEKPLRRKRFEKIPSQRCSSGAVGGEESGDVEANWAGLKSGDISQYRRRREQHSFVHGI